MKPPKYFFLWLSFSVEWISLFSFQHLAQVVIMKVGLSYSEINVRKEIAKQTNSKPTEGLNN